MTNSATSQKQALSKLESIAQAAEELETTVMIRDKNGDEFILYAIITNWLVSGFPKEAGALYPDMSAPRTQPNEERPFLKRNYRGPGNRQKWGTTGEKLYTFSETIACLATDLPGSTLLVDTIKVKSKGSSVKGAELKQAAIEAWCEAAGITAPSAKEIKEAKAKTKNAAAEKRAQIQDQLRSGEAGIKEWNQQPLKTKQAIDLQGLDLSGANLRNADFSSLNISGSNFSSSNLTGAIFKYTAMKNCNFNDAILHDTELINSDATGSTFHNADFKTPRSASVIFNKAKLTNARFSEMSFVNALCNGADFTGATFKDCKFANMNFDQNTILPDNFDSWDALLFQGTGVDPRKVKVFNESHASEPLDFDAFLKRLETCMDKDRLKKSLSMLKKDSFQLFSEVTNDSVTGIVKSQTDKDLVYSCRLTSEGKYSCCTQNLNVCGGLRGAICKHILVLMLGLAKANELDANKADLWARASALHQPKLDKDIASEIFLKYKGAEAGEIDWRPTETTPEDFYAF